MDIGFYRLSEIDAQTKARLMKRSGADIEDVIERVRPIIADVEKRGDEALIEYAQKFDKAELDGLKVSSEEFSAARQTLDPKIKSAIDHCAQNVRKFHKAQMERANKDKEWMIEIEPGVFAGEKVTPIHSVGLYVPGG